MNSSYSKKRHIQQSNLLVESRFLQKKNDNNLILEASTPFKNKEEGNDFRNWVNDNYPDWAKENQLDRSGQFNNSYIQKAYQEFGDQANLGLNLLLKIVKQKVLILIWQKN